MFYDCAPAEMLGCETLAGMKSFWPKACLYRRPEEAWRGLFPTPLYLSHFFSLPLSLSLSHTLSSSLFHPPPPPLRGWKEELTSGTSLESDNGQREVLHAAEERTPEVVFPFPCRFVELLNQQATRRSAGRRRTVGLFIGSITHHNWSCIYLSISK